MSDAERNLLGWPTEALIQLDALAPGVLSTTIRASPMRRHAIFTVLADRLGDTDSTGTAPAAPLRADAVLALTVRERRARDILEHTFGRVPDGWLGALGRLGAHPMQSTRSYRKLTNLFLDPKNERKAKALRYVEHVREITLYVLDALDERWVHPHTVTRLPSPLAAKDFNHAIAFAQLASSKATDAAVFEAIERLTDDTTISAVVARFVRRADRFPPHPVPMEDDDIRPLMAGADFIEAGRRLRNCLATKIDEAATGQAAFAELKRELAILEFRPLSLGLGWMLHDVHVAQNGHVDTKIMDAARAKCGALGIPYVEDRDSDEDWRRYSRFMHADFGRARAAARV